MLETNAQPAQPPEQPPEQRTRRWKRTATTALLMLVCGAMLNVAVAWGLMIYDARFAAPWDPFEGVPVAADMQQRVLHELFNGMDDETLRMLTGTGGVLSSQKGGVRRVCAIYGSGIGHMRTAVGAGWPCYCLHSSEVWSTARGKKEREHAWIVTTPGRGEIVLPLRPSPAGFIINTLFYGLLLWLLYFAPFAARRVLRRKRRLCEKCAYPVGTSPVCTECGAAVMRRQDA